MSAFEYMPTHHEDPATWREVLGATDIVAVLGLSPFRSPLQVWLEKRGQTEDKPPTDRMKRGIFLEPSIAEFYADATGEELAPVRPFRTGVLAASPDRQTLRDKRFVEIKTHTPWVRRQYGEPYTANVPVAIEAQVTAQVAVARRCGHLEAAKADIHHVAAFFGDEFGVFLVQYDPEVGEDILARAEAWWERHMVEGEPPEPGAGQADSDWIARTYPVPTAEAKQADADAERLLAEYRQAYLDAKAADAQREALANRVKVLIGDAAELHSSLGTFTYRPVAGREMVDAKALRAGYPDVYAQVVKHTAGYRRLDPPKGWIE